MNPLNFAKSARSSQLLVEEGSHCKEGSLYMSGYLFIRSIYVRRCQLLRSILAIYDYLNKYPILIFMFQNKEGNIILF